MKKAAPFVAIAFIAIALEIFLFNYKSLLSMFNSEVQVMSYRTDSGIVNPINEEYKPGKSNPYIEIENINAHIKNLHIDVQIIPSSQTVDNALYNGVNDAVKVYIYADDEANAQCFRLGERSVVHEVPQSQYMITHLSGNTNRVRFLFAIDDNTIIRINSISYNARIPFTFSIIRVIAVIIMLGGIYMLRPASDIYKILYNPLDKWQIIIKMSAFIIIGLCCFALVKANTYFVYPRWQHHYQYQELAQSIAKGQVSLMQKPSDGLMAMDNPYDCTARELLGVEYRWDSAYYNGKYYVYYGILPELIFYLPCYLITGEHADTFVAIYITGLMWLAGIFYLMDAVAGRWFAKLPFIVYMLAVVLTAAGSGIMVTMIRPDFYSLPIIMAVALSVWGLGLWIGARDRQSGELNKIKLAAGSLCMALVAACRPQLLVMSFIALILFYREAFVERKLVIGRKFKNTAAFLMPYIVTAAGVMYYNAIRFGSVFDFGANYNLTTNDMTQRGFRMGRTALGMFCYLLQTPEVNGIFPFVQGINVSTSYLGTTITEPVYGGIIACNVFLLPVIMYFIGRKYKKGYRNVWRLGAACIVMGLVIIVADTQMAGILARYCLDFEWIFFLAATLAVFIMAVHPKIRNNTAYAYGFKIFLMIAFAQGMIYNFLRIFVKMGEGVMECNPVFYYRIAHAVAFWM